MFWSKSRKRQGIIELVERIAVAAEKQAAAVIASHESAVMARESELAANEAIRQKNTAEKSLIEQEAERRNRLDNDVFKPSV